MNVNEHCGTQPALLGGVEVHAVQALSPAQLDPGTIEASTGVNQDRASVGRSVGAVLDVLAPASVGTISIDAHGRRSVNPIA